MIVGRRAFRYTGCANCRLSLLKTFTSVAGLPIRPVSRISLKSVAYRALGQQAQYSSRHPAEDREHGLGVETPIKVSETEIDDFLGEENPKEGREEFAEEESLELEVDNVPWYMQVESPQMTQRTLSDRQRIPGLPENPPQLLEPLLQQISIDLGLDDLTLLDLRKLDPPPALGSNLLMILGTARSEKHLHVSADRLCRWLRSTYKLRPEADGLLGRNELKLRLKRKSRRAKLMGSSSMDDTDDGVRTGWVCVNVGVVESPNVETTDPAQVAGYVGFGRRTDGISIVVQMLTEEKRAEIDLEQLWSGILRRGIQAQTGQDQIVGPTSVNYRAGALSSSQTRGLHTSTCPPSPDAASMPWSSSSNISLNDLQHTVLDYVNTGQYRAALQAFEKYSKSKTDLGDGKWKTTFLSLLCERLQDMSHEEAMQVLGTASNDYASTDFLYCYYKCLSAFPSDLEWEARLCLHFIAREHGHKGYKVQSMVDLLSEMQLCGGQVSKDTYLRALHSLLLPKMSLSGKLGGASQIGIDAALRLLQSMHSQGINILTEEVYMALVEATELVPEEEPTGISNDHIDTFGLPSIPQSLIQNRVHTIFNMLDLPTFSAESTIRLMDLYARQRTWEAFWDTWRKVAREGKPRTPAMYASMFRNVAMMRNQKACMAVLRDWIPSMDLEVPKVNLDGDVKQAVMICLKIADPAVKEDAADAESNGEWASIWRKCVDVEMQ